MSIRTLRLLAISSTMFLTAMVPAASAQTADAESVKALRELVAEVRSLRAAIEQYANTQIQAQSVGELLSVQQRRVADVISRLDVARREIDANSAETRRMSTHVANIEESLRRVGDAKQRAQLEMERDAIQQELEQRSSQEQTARTRETELSNTLAVEEAKWNDLVDRMNQWLKR